MDQPVTIPAEVANHVLFHEGHGGYPAGSFTSLLLAAWPCADVVNRAKLAAGWPEYGAAIALLQQRDGLDQLKAIANRHS